MALDQVGNLYPKVHPDTKMMNGQEFVSSTNKELTVLIYTIEESVSSTTLTLVALKK